MAGAIQISATSNTQTDSVVCRLYVPLIFGFRLTDNICVIILAAKDSLPNTPARHATHPTVPLPVFGRRYAHCFCLYALFSYHEQPKAHNQCSETFYKKEIEADIHSGPSKTAQERQRMLDLLKKFEEEEASGQFLGGDDENEEDDDEFNLAKRFESVDLGASKEYWSSPLIH